jgi:hypothetical protein
LGVPLIGPLFAWLFAKAFAKSAQTPSEPVPRATISRPEKHEHHRDEVRQKERIITIAIVAWLLVASGIVTFFGLGSLIGQIVLVLTLIDVGFLWYLKHKIRTRASAPESGVAPRQRTRR